MKTTILVIATAFLLLSSQCHAGHDHEAEDQGRPRRRLGSPRHLAEKRTNPEVLDPNESISANYAATLFGKDWSEREMDYVGGTEFLQMFDDEVETLILMRGNIDLQVESIQGVFIFADREIRDVYGNDRGRAQGTCAHTSIGKQAYTCSINLEILADDGFVSAAFRSEGYLDFGEQVSQLTVTGGHTELESASGTLKLSTTDPATPGNAADEGQFRHLFFEGAVFVDSSFLTSIMAED